MSYAPCLEESGRVVGGEFGPTVRGKLITDPVGDEDATKGSDQAMCTCGSFLDDRPVAIPVHNHKEIVSLEVEVVCSDALEWVGWGNRGCWWCSWLGRCHPVAWGAKPAFLDDCGGHTGPEDRGLGTRAHLCHPLVRGVQGLKHSVPERWWDDHAVFEQDDSIKTGEKFSVLVEWAKVGREHAAMVGEAILYKGQQSGHRGVTSRLQPDVIPCDGSDKCRGWRVPNRASLDGHIRIWVYPKVEVVRGVGRSMGQIGAIECGDVIREG